MSKGLPKSLKWLAKCKRGIIAGTIIGLLLVVLSSFVPPIQFSFDNRGYFEIGTSSVQADYLFADVDITDIQAYAQLEKSGCTIRKGNIQLRFDLFLKPDAPGYYIHYVRVPDVNSIQYKAGYTGKVDKFGNPINQAAYEIWLDSLPKVWQNNPFLSVFIFVDATTSVEYIKQKEVVLLEEAYKYWVKNNGNLRGVGRALPFDKLRRTGLSSRISQNIRLNLLKANEGYFSIQDVTTVDFSIGSANFALANPDPIDIGAAAIDRSFKSSIRDSTLVNKENPANASGTITSYEIWLYARPGLNDVWLGTFSFSGNVGTVRDSESIGDIASGSKQTGSGLDIDVELGDYWGCHDKGAYNTEIEVSTSGGLDIWTYGGECINPTDSQTFNVGEDRTISLYGEGESVAAPPTVTTQAVSDIDITTATGNGNITDNGGEDASAWGVCYNTTGNPTTGDSTAAGSGAGGVGAFTASMTGLTPGEHYYVKAYATNTGGTGYGSQVEFDTLESPAVTTSAATNVEETTATLNGNVTAINDTSITERGFVWDTSTHGDPGNTAPGVSDYASNWTESDGFGTGAFDHGLTSLTEGELYYVRACAENDDNIWGYGDEVTFLTKPDEPTSLNGTPGDEHIDLTWAKGDGAQKTMIRFRTDGTYPTSYTDGTQAYYDTGAAYDHTSLTNGLTYYYRAWSYATEGGKEQWSDTYSQYSGTPFVAPTVTASAATNVEETTATLNGNITSLEGGGNCTVRGFEWDYDSGVPYSYDVHEDGDFGTGAYALGITGIEEGQLVYFRAYATNPSGTGYSSELNFLTKPDPPSTFTATAVGEEQIDLAWTNGDGSQKVYIRGKLGSAPTNRTDGAYSWNGVGTETSHSGLSADQHWYYIIWSYATEGALEQTSDTPDLSDDATTLTPPSVTSLMVEGTGSDAYGCWVILRGQVTNDQGLTIDTTGFNYGLTAGYGSTASQSGDWNTGDDFVLRIGGLASGTTYHWRAFASDGVTGYGSDMYFTTVGSATLYEYLNTGQDGDSTAIYAGNWKAQYFTTDSVSHSVTSIRVYLKRVLLPGTITVSIKYADDAYKPTGVDLCSGTYDGDNLNTAYGWVEFTVDEVSLEASIEYAVVVRAVAGDGSNYVMWGKDAGGGLANANGWSSSDDGISWSDDSPIDYLFELWGYPVLSVESGAVFNSYWEDDDILFVLEYKNFYPPYYPDYDCPTYFSIRLYDTDGTTLIASTSCRAWGNKPGAIYLSADQSVPLTPDSAFYLKLVLNSDTDIVASYQLQSVDWKGDDLAGLDRWVITTAHSIETYYGVPLTEFVGDQGEVLNEEGGIIFATGIPALSDIRPDLFKVVVHVPGYEAEDWTNAFHEGADWETSIGEGAAGVLTTGGGFVGIDGKGLGTFLLLGAYLAIALLVVGKQSREGGFIGAGLAIPVLLTGTWLGLLDIVYIAVAASIAILLLVYSLWWSRT